MPDTSEAIKFDFRAQDGALIPHSDHWRNRAVEKFEDGKSYFMTDRISRSDGSHNHYFKHIQIAFDNLPESLSEKFPTKDILRHTALMETGYFDEFKYVLSDEKQAREYVKHIRRGKTGAFYSIVKNVIVERVVHSQSNYAMDEKDRFEKSKNDVLAWCAELIGVTLSDLTSSMVSAADSAKKPAQTKAEKHDQKPAEQPDYLEGEIAKLQEMRDALFSGKFDKIKGAEKKDLAKTFLKSPKSFETAKNLWIDFNECLEKVEPFEDAMKRWKVALG